MYTRNHFPNAALSISPGNGTQRTRSVGGAEGGEEGWAKGQIEREEAAKRYDQNADVGYPEYTVYARKFGEGEKAWMSV